jgi:hypothetical protein
MWKVVINWMIKIRKMSLKWDKVPRSLHLRSEIKENVQFWSGMGKTCSLHQTFSHSTAFSVWDIDLGFFASCRYWPNLACTTDPGPVICQGWPGEPAKKFRCSLFIPALEELQTPNVYQRNKCLMGRPARD